MNHESKLLDEFIDIFNLNKFVYTIEYLDLNLYSDVLAVVLTRQHNAL